MSLLGILDLAVVATRGIGHMIIAIQLCRLRSSGRHGLLGQRCGVGTHVGDVATLIQTLGHPHGALGIPPKTAGPLLLQGRCHERSLGAALAWLLHHGTHRVVDTLEGEDK